MLLSNDAIAEIRKRAEAATPGPWWTTHSVDDGWGVDSAATQDTRLGGIAYDLDEHEAAFIAHARADIPALLADRDELVRRLAKVRVWAIVPEPPSK